MHDHQHHETLIKDVEVEYKEILENSKQGIYIYLEDSQKICNDKFAQMLGYTKEEWQKPAEFVETFVADESANTLVGAFQKAMEDFEGSTVDVTWKTKEGGTKKTEVILVPITSQGHTFALHFITEK